MKALINFEYKDVFERLSGIEAIALYPYERLDVPVCCHADMLFCVIDNNVFYDCNSLLELQISGTWNSGNTLTIVDLTYYSSGRTYTRDTY